MFNKTETSQNVNTTMFFTKWLHVKGRHGDKWLSWMEAREGFKAYGIGAYIIWEPSIIYKKNENY